MKASEWGRFRVPAVRLDARAHILANGDTVGVAHPITVVWPVAMLADELVVHDILDSLLCVWVVLFFYFTFCIEIIIPL